MEMCDSPHVGVSMVVSQVSLTNHAVDHNKSCSEYLKIPKPTATVSGFKDPSHALLLPMVPVWQVTLRQVEVSLDHCHSSAKVVGINGLSFPQPDLFMSIQNSEKCNACFHAWLRL